MSDKDWNTRLRYAKIDGVEVTQMPVICDKKVCHGFVSGSDWWVVNLSAGKRVMEGTAKSNELAKRELKKAFIALGAHFTEEVRATKDNPIRMLTDKVIDDIIEQKGEER
jgi:hypothetical protein